ncbi:MAG: hypothetical protein JWN48_4257 [Myxococcaceae bacterium]|nr:hypothetical protein [Myxococcaceae bacterium]
MDTQPMTPVVPAFATPPHFDHVFVTVDDETLREVNACEFLAGERLGRFLIRESESSLIGKYTPTRIFGENTLVELFPNKFGEGEEFASVTVGVVFSFDHPGERISARNRLAAEGIPYRGELIERTLVPGSDPVPWYHSTRPQMGPGSPITLFFSELSPDFLQRIGARIGPDGRQDRSANLEAALQRPHGPRHLMRDLVGVTVRLRPARIGRVVQILSALGYALRETAREVQLHGPDSVVTLIPDEVAIEGLLSLQIKLARPADEPGLRFDFGPASSLVLSPLGAHDDTATWSFEPRKAR